MALPVKQQVTYWGVAAAIFLLLLWFLDDVIMPFLLGAAIAYFLDPVADRLEAAGFSRIWATSIISIAAVLIFVIAALLVVPALVAQAIGLIQSAPAIVSDLQAFITQRFPELGDANSTIRQSLGAFGDAIQSRGNDLFGSVLASFSSFINVLVLAVVTPVVAFYLLLDWDKIVAQIDTLLPRDHAPDIRQIFRDIDRTMAGFLRGQGTCLLYTSDAADE